MKKATEETAEYVELGEVHHGLFAAPEDLKPKKHLFLPTPNRRRAFLWCTLSCFFGAVVLAVFLYIFFPRQPTYTYLCTTTDRWHLTRQSSVLYPQVDIHMTSWFRFDNVNAADLKIHSMKLDMFHWGKKIGSVGQQNLVLHAKQKSQLVNFQLNITAIGVVEGAELFWDSMDKQVHLEFKGEIVAEYLHLKTTQHLEFTKLAQTQGEVIDCPPKE